MERTEAVQELQEHGSSLLCLGVPEGALFGIDYAAWTVGPRFMGVKLVPPGLHYVYVSARSDDVGVARTGFFISLPPATVVVRKWDQETETLVQLSPEDNERYADGVREHDFDANLGPYRVENAAQWAELTRHATSKLVRRIEPVAGLLHSSLAEYDGGGPVGLGLDGPVELGEEGEEDGDQQRAPEDGEQQRAHVDGEQQQRIESNAGGGLFFSQIPRVRVPKSATPAEVTRLHTDRSPQLEELLAKAYGGEELLVLGELQIAYVAFVLGQNHDAFEQWKALLILLCGCEGAIASRPRLFSDLLRVLFAQLSQAPGDLFSDNMLEGNFVGACALALIEVCAAESAPPTVQRRAGKLRELVERKFGVGFEDLALLGEDAPQVIDADGILESCGPGFTCDDPASFMELD